jgi:hypothetical protein
MGQTLGHGKTQAPAPAPAPQAASTGGADPVAVLKQLKQMLDAELISQAEYDQKKADILGRM